MAPPLYVVTFLVAAAAIILILRIPVRNDYLNHGRLRPSAVLWPSWRGLGTVLLLAVLSHVMVVTEEEFLRRTLSRPG